MLYKAVCVLSAVHMTLAGSYAPPPVIQPSISAYGSPNYNYANSYANQPYVSIAPAPLPTVPAPLPAVSPPQTYSYPIQPGQGVYDAASSVYNDQYDTTTLPPTTPLTVPVVESVGDEEKYGVPEIVSSFNANPTPTAVPSQPVPSQAGYAPPPAVPAASSAYGAPPVASSYGSLPSPYNDLEYNAGEVPTAVVQPGTVPQPGSGDAPLSTFYPARAIRSQKKTAEKRQKLLH